MLELFCKIPDHIGWMLVGILSALCALMLFNLDKILAQMWKDRHEEESEE